MFSDNRAAIALTRDHQYHARTKHINCIDVRYHWIRWVIEQARSPSCTAPLTTWSPTRSTKALPSAKVKHFAADLGLLAK